MLFMLSFAMKFIARIILKMKIMMPITKIVASERNLFLKTLVTLKLKAFFIKLRFEGLIFILRF